MKRLATSLSNIILIFSLVSCSIGLDGMVSQYNGGMKEEVVVDDNFMLYPGDEGFDASLMLPERYVVGNDCTINLFAPKAASYSWKLYSIYEQYQDLFGTTYHVGTEYTEIIIPGYIPVNRKQFVIYLPDLEDLLECGSYKLELTVTDSAGKTYVDSANLVIYKPYYLK